MIKLNIVIPTYNRPTELENTLKSLVNLYHNVEVDVSINVLINFHSRTDSAHYLSMFEGFLLKTGITIGYSFNRINVGGSANVLRALEVCSDSDWTWVLSDDDELVSGFEDILVKQIRDSRNNISCIKFDSNLYGNIKEGFRVNNVNDVFVNNHMCHDYFSNLLFLSNYCFRTEHLSEYMIGAYRYVGSFGPQLFMMLLMVKGGNSVYFSSKRIVNSKITQSGGWNGTIVHNSLYEHFRISDIGLSRKAILNIRSALFNESYGKGILGRYLRARDQYEPSCLRRLIFGDATYGIFVRISLWVLERVLPIFSGILDYKKESGSQSRF